MEIPNERPFYSSLNLHDSLVLLNANDYNLYAYDRHTGRQKWTYPLKWKSDLPPYFCGNFIWATNGKNQVLKIEPSSGKVVKTLEVSSVETQPFVKNDILYFTGIYDGGCLIAYDLKSDSILWKRFLAHGYSRTPYYLQDKIIANAEGDQWIELNYDGSLKVSGCDNGFEEDVFPSELPCARQFIALDHSGIEINGKLAAKLGLSSYAEPEIKVSSKYTFIVHEDRVYKLGKNQKRQSTIQLNTLAAEIESGNDVPVKILHADDENISLFYNMNYVLYSHRDKKLLKVINLSEWEPHQVLLDDTQLWLISRKDGQLYGLSINE